VVAVEPRASEVGELEGLSRDDPAGQVACFRAFQRTGSYEEAAASLGLSVSSLKKRLVRLYARIGAVNAVHASYLLRDEPW